MKKEVKEIIDFYYNSHVFSKENILYNFLAAHFHQDADLDDRVVVKEYIEKSSQRNIKPLCDAIDDLISSNNFKEENIKEFIAETTSYTTLPGNAFNWLLEKKRMIIKFCKDDVN